MNFSVDQNRAIATILDWIHSKNPAHYFVLAGFAGTGKTTLIGHIRTSLYEDNPSHQVAYCAYTGKATQVLRHKLVTLDALYPGDSVSTIHSLIYAPIRNDIFEIIGWKRQTVLNYDLIIVDEASMISEEIWKDLLAFNIPILAVGDHGQLPPIHGSFNLMTSPTVTLEHIHRQAQDNPIIQLSFQARKEGHIPIGQFGPGVRKVSKGGTPSRMIVTSMLRKYHSQLLILCGYNTTRIRLNRAIRHIQKKPSEPTIQDQVICLRNNHSEGVFNGMIGTIDSLVSYDEHWYQAQIIFPERIDPYKGFLYKPQFDNTSTISYEELMTQSIQGDLFDFGYAMTVHKAQGSQAKEVLLFEERFPQMDDDTWRRWLYTAITRAEERLTIIGN